MRVIRRAASSMPELFGFLVLALVIAAGSCRFNRPEARVVYPNPCSEERLRELYGDDWHIAYALLGCWMMEPEAIAAKSKQPSTPVMFSRPRLVIR